MFRNLLNENNIQIFSVEHNNNSEVYTIIRENEILICNIFFNSEQFFSSVVVQIANSITLFNDFKYILETKMK